MAQANYDGWVPVGSTEEDELATQEVQGDTGTVDFDGWVPVGQEEQEAPQPVAVEDQPRQAGVWADAGDLESEPQLTSQNLVQGVGESMQRMEPQYQAPTNEGTWYEDSSIGDRLKRIGQVFTTEQTPEKVQYEQRRDTQEKKALTAEDPIVKSTMELIEKGAIEMMNANPDMDYESAIQKVRSNMKGDAVEFATDILLTAATGGIYAGGRAAVSKAAPRAVAAVDKAVSGSRLANAGKYAIINAGENVVSGVSGNVAAGRDTMEGTDTDALFGAGVGGLVGGIFKPKSPDIQARADEYTTARTEFDGRVEQARQANNLERIKETLDQEAIISRKVGDTANDIEKKAFVEEYKAQRKSVEEQARRDLGSSVDSAIAKRNEMIAARKDESAAKIKDYQETMEYEATSQPEIASRIQKEYGDLIAKEREKYSKGVLKMEDDFNSMVQEAKVAREARKPGGRAENEMDIRIDELENERMYSLYDLKLESERRIELYRESMSSELKAGGLPRDIRKKYTEMINKEKELAKTDAAAIKTEYDDYVKAEREAYSFNAPDRDIQASNDAARIVEEQAENLYRRAYQTEADKFTTNTRKRLTESDLDDLKSTMGKTNSRDMERLNELNKYVDDTVPTYQTSLRGEFDTDVYNIPPTNTSFYRDFGGKERLENIIEGKREYAANPRQSEMMEEMALADLMESGIGTRMGVDLTNMSNAGLLSRLGQGFEAGANPAAPFVREVAEEKAITASRNQATKVLDDVLFDTTEKLGGRVKSKVLREELESVSEALKDIRKKINSGAEIDAIDVAPLVNRVDADVMEVIEEMVNLSKYTNRAVSDIKVNPWSARNMLNLGTRALGGLASYSTFGKAGLAAPAVRELATGGIKADMISANKLSKAQLAAQKADRAVEEGIDTLTSARALETSDDYARATSIRDNLKAERAADPDYARYVELSKKKDSRTKAEETEVNRLYNKFKNINSEINRINRAIGGDAKVQVRKAGTSLKAKQAAAKKKANELETMLNKMSKADQLKYLKNKALRDAARVPNTDEE